MTSTSDKGARPTPVWLTPAEVGVIAGYSVQSVRLAVREGRIPPDAVRRSPAGRYEVEVHAAHMALRGCPVPPEKLMGQEVAPGARVTYRGEPAHLSDARKKYWDAKLAELKYRESSGELVPGEDTAGKYADAAVRTRTKLLAIPQRIQQRSGLPDDQISAIDAVIREVLTELSATEPGDK